MSFDLYTIKKILKISSEISAQIPNKNDNIFVFSTKILSIFDSITNHIKLFKQADDITSFVNRFGKFEQKYNAHFAGIFFNTLLYNEFKIKEYIINDYQNLIHAKCKFGELIFVKYTDSQDAYSRSFYHTIGFDFIKLMNVFWEKYSGRILLESKIAGNASYERTNTVTLSPYNQKNDAIFGSLLNEKAKFKEMHNKYVKDNVQRTYLFYGKPGTGKSSFALSVAQELSNRILILNADGLKNFLVSDLGFLLDCLNPEFLIIDDIDRIDMEDSLSTLFLIFSEFKSKYNKISVIITLNDINSLDQALIRPGRVDEIIEFKTPDEDDRREILSRYLIEFGISEYDIDEIIIESEGLTAAFLKEISVQIKYKSKQEVLNIIYNMKKIFGIESAMESEGSEDSEFKEDITEKKIINKSSSKNFRKLLSKLRRSKIHV